MGQFGIGGAVLGYGYITGSSPRTLCLFSKNTTIDFAAVRRRSAGVELRAVRHVCAHWHVQCRKPHRWSGWIGYRSSDDLWHSPSPSSPMWPATQSSRDTYPCPTSPARVNWRLSRWPSWGPVWASFGTTPTRHKSFMGDVGSLSLGGAFGILAILTKNEILLVLVGGIFVLEAISVILQVGSYKMTGEAHFRHGTHSSPL